MKNRAPLLPLPGIALALALALLSCSSTGPVPAEVRQQVEKDPAAALPKLEQLAQQYPAEYDVHMLLGQSHYKLARKALDLHDEPTYLRHVEQATDQFVHCVGMRPADAGPHIWLAMIDAYQGNMDGALRSLQKAQQLAPNSPVSYTNLAQVYIYLDKLSRARAMLARARKLGGPGPYVELNEMLASWKEGDMQDARDLFDGVYAKAPDAVQTFDEAPVSSPIKSFDDYVAYCCGNPSCGPYMRGPCLKAKQQVSEREVTLETLRREQQIAREAREKLRKVYSGEREVTIEGEEPSAEPKPQPKK
jgi:tetratricopeptide (TPR) repeat protein